MPDDFIYTVNQVALILNKSDKTVRTYIAEAGLDSTKRIEQASGMEKVYISASSLASLADKRSFRLNFDELRKYTPNREVLEHTFGKRLFGEPKDEQAPSPPESSASLPTTSNTTDESLVVSILKEQVSRLEAEKNELKQDLKEKDRQLEEKNVALIATTRENSDRYQLLALAKEQAEAQWTQLREQTRILHLSTNRDILRLKDGKLQAGDLSLLPVVEAREGEFWTESPPEERWSPSPPAGEAIRIDPDPTPPITPAADEPEKASDTEDESAEPVPLPTKHPAPKQSSPKKGKPKALKQEKERAAPKKGFFRRLFGG